MRAWIVLAFGLAACKGDDTRPRAADPPPAPRADPAPGCVDGIAAARAAAGTPDGGLGALLAACRPCGVAWDPLIALSAQDPDTPADGLPGPDDVLAVMEACEATCQGTARTEVAELLRRAQEGRTAAGPWRKIAEACPGALRVDDHTRRFARGTWYALDQVTRALWRADAPADLRAARDAAPLTFPLPPLSEASTSIALPRTDAVAAWAPRLHLTITDAKVHVGVLPWATLGERGPALVPGPGLDYPGDDATADPAAALAAAAAALAGSTHPADAEHRPVVIAPRGMRASRLLTVITGLAEPVHLAATPRTRGAAPWPEPVAPVAVAVTALPHAGAVQVVIPAHASVADLVDAIAPLAARGVGVAMIRIDPATSP